MAEKITTKPFGITEKKKAELDKLMMSVLDAQQEVNQFQAIVTALTQKLNNFQAWLASADSNRVKALNNKNMADQLVQSALDLVENANIAFEEITNADAETKILAGNAKMLVDKLIYSAVLINKLANLVIRKKALNPLISDELVSMISTAGTDANNAVALTLVALQSAFAAQAANIESERVTAIALDQAKNLYSMITGNSLPDENDTVVNNKEAKLQNLFSEAYENTKTMYNHVKIACTNVTTQLNNANTSLNKAQVKLVSLQSGLAAANAAALAS